MTDQELQELREWAARKMGWSKENLTPQSSPEYDVWVNSQGVIQFSVEAFRPDQDLNQCFLLVEKMREEGWKLRLERLSACFGSGFKWTGDKTKKKIMFEFDPNPALAILKAAKATEDK